MEKQGIVIFRMTYFGQKSVFKKKNNLATLIHLLLSVPTNIYTCQETQ